MSDAPVTIFTALCIECLFLSQEMGQPSTHHSSLEGRMDAAFLLLSPQLRFADLAPENDSDLPILFSTHPRKAVPKCRHQSPCGCHSRHPNPAAAPGYPNQNKAARLLRCLPPYHVGEGGTSLPPSHRIPSRPGGSSRGGAAPRPPHPPQPCHRAHRHRLPARLGPHRAPAPRRAQPRPRSPPHRT